MLGIITIIVIIQKTVGIRNCWVSQDAIHWEDRIINSSPETQSSFRFRLSLELKLIKETLCCRDLRFLTWLIKEDNRVSVLNCLLILCLNFVIQLDINFYETNFTSYSIKGSKSRLKALIDWLIGTNGPKWVATVIHTVSENIAHYQQCVRRRHSEVEQRIWHHNNSIKILHIRSLKNTHSLFHYNSISRKLS